MKKQEELLMMIDTRNAKTHIYKKLKSKKIEKIFLYFYQITQ